MPRTNETPEQRKARTAAARKALSGRFTTEEERCNYYREMARKRWAARKAAHTNEDTAGGPND